MRMQKPEPSFQFGCGISINGIHTQAALYSTVRAHTAQIKTFSSNARLWRWRQNAHLRHQPVITSLHGTTSHKTWMFNNTAVKTSNLRAWGRCWVAHQIILLSTSSVQNFISPTCVSAVS